MAETASVSQDNGEVASDMQEEGLNGYLTPLQKSVLFELTTRRRRIASARSRADFWLKEQARRDDLDSDILDEDALDDLIAERKEELTRLKEARQIKQTVVEVYVERLVRINFLILTSHLVLGPTLLMPSMLQWQLIALLNMKRNL